MTSNQSPDWPEDVIQWRQWAIKEGLLMPGWQAVRRMEDEEGGHCSSGRQGRAVTSARRASSSLPPATPLHECGVSLTFLVQFVEAVQETEWLPVSAHHACGLITVLSVCTSW